MDFDLSALIILFATFPVDLIFGDRERQKD